jgi:UDP-N-acetylglucosamine:LPS N-acetylglucosamine transferase
MIKVMFHRVEAGFGHIMTCNAVEEIFSKKYGSRVEVININFNSDTQDAKLKKYGEFLKTQVRNYTAHPMLGHFSTFSCEFWGTDLSTWGTLKFQVPGSYKKGIEFLQSFQPDVVFSTHWATNYYAELMNPKPFTVKYCPDALLNKLFKFRAKLSLVSMEIGYTEAKRDTTYDSSNLKLVPFCIRYDAFKMKETIESARKKLNLPDKFTVVLAEGGYGRGAMKKIVTKLLKEHVAVTVIPVCGKNEELLEYFKKLTPTEEITFLPQGFITNIFE